MSQSQAWMPRERWDALVRGEHCPLCAEVASTAHVNEYGYTISDLNLSRLRLATNQFVAGYCVLISTQHVREPYELRGRDCALFFEDMMRAARALERVFSPIKMNFEILGNAVPHLHCHILPRYYGDPAPSRPIDQDAQQVLLTPDEYNQRVDLIRAALQ